MIDASSLQLVPKNMSSKAFTHNAILELIRKTISDYDFQKFDKFFKAMEIEWYRGPELLRSDVFSAVLPLAKMAFVEYNAKPNAQFKVSVGMSFIHVNVESCNHNTNIRCYLTFVYGSGESNYLL